MIMEGFTQLIELQDLKSSFANNNKFIVDEHAFNYLCVNLDSSSITKCRWKYIILLQIYSLKIMY